ncbi:hypothetical protein DYB37_011685 [Aphanomyces astaci]|uniref:Uncharacterized protein n=2 Tax=Aphanomyces astaci TaxID=112090 RepID=A0A397FSV1_APHAT|nr:hypothetical protein AaE_000776 [Aphanomyces astaci]RHX97082.1 hypothetical protein DYB25_006221 [Aphanomyces astaci]RHY24724.1 hypothetical protein DYB36_001347 [Aphanomyces astaci]RHY39252.1 hypothetical protein DYB30_002846 [Aphanomyces astaci]RHY44372.1 hypothetical protein DYB34_000437 [Aphanomyces astaci]
MMKLKEAVKEFDIPDAAHTTRTRLGYAQLSHLTQDSSPCSDTSLDTDELKGWEDLVSSNSSKGPMPSPYAILCAIISIFGFFFLLFLGSTVASNSIYIRVKPKEGHAKSSLAANIFLAAFLYLVAFVGSIVSLLRARRAQKVFQLSLDIHADK